MGMLLTTGGGWRGRWGRFIGGRVSLGFPQWPTAVLTTEATTRWVGGDRGPDSGIGRALFPSLRA